ncbi:MAG: exodeoxyribonuclease VII large subunit [Candidatus Saccharibacteria bacterium]
MKDNQIERNRILSVLELTSHIRTVLENDRALQNVWVRGEISDFKYYQKSGHMYFSLKDEESSINCVMFRGKARSMDFMPDNGMKVVARGYVSVFEKYGRYQYYVEEMEPDGLGRLFMSLNQLRERLEKEGLFDSSRKRPLPAYVNHLGIVTSADGAAVRDIIRIVKHRHPRCEIVLAPAAVQGLEASSEIANGIRALNEWGRPEVIIVGRGGGSFEDLWAFNTEEVVRAIAGSKIPIISAVGHEVDFSLADLAADARAATPTQAGQMAVPDMEAVTVHLYEMAASMRRSVERRYNLKWAELDYMRERRIWQQPQMLTEKVRRELEFAMRQIGDKTERLLTGKQHELHRLGAALDALSPLKVLDRGYAIARKASGDVVKNIEQLDKGDQVELAVRNGEVTVEVLEKRVKKWGK